MCEQCTTKMLAVYSETKNDQNVYIGIARQQYMDDYEAGDVMVGVCNGPDMVFRLDLFTDHQWTTNTYDDEFHEHHENGWLWDAYTQYNPWFQIPSKLLRLSKHFGRPPERDNHFFESWIMVSVAQVFQQRGIPLAKQERLEWARQFGEKVDCIMHRRSFGMGRPELGIRHHEYRYQYYRPTGETNEGGWQTTEWVEGTWSTDEPIPKDVKPRSKDEFMPEEVASGGDDQA